MKRILSGILCLMLLLTVFVQMVPVFAATSPSIKCEDVTCKPGETITVDVIIDNNPGFSYLEMTPVFSEELALIGVTNGKMISDFTEGIQYVWSSDEDTTENGILMTFTFTVSLSVLPGDYSVGFILRTCGNNNEQKVDFTVISGTIKIEASSSLIAGRQVSLGQDITVKYYADLSPAHAGAQMRFTEENGHVTLVDGVEENGKMCYVFGGMAPQRLGDEIRADLVCDGKVLDTHTGSVLDYCRELLASSPEELGISAAKYEKLRTLIADFMAYGAAAQVYLGYKTGALVTDDEEIAKLTPSAFVPLPDDWKREILGEGTADIWLTAAGLWFDNTNRLYFKFHAAGITEQNFAVTIDDGVTTVRYKLSDFEALGNDVYVLYTDPICASKLSGDTADLYTVVLNTVTKRLNKEVDTPVQTLYYCVPSYVFTMQNSANANMAALAKTMYNYGTSAVAYNAAK